MPLTIPSGGGSHIRTGLTPVRQCHSSKGHRALLPHTNAASWPPLAPGDGHAHLASQLATGGPHDTQKHMISQLATSGNYAPGLGCTHTVSQMASRDNHVGTHVGSPLCTHTFFSADGHPASADAEVPPIKGWKVLAQRTKAGCLWCGTPWNVQHHSVGHLGLLPLGAILQFLPLGLCTAQALALLLNTTGSPA
jgi:hypothetical protein